MQTKFHNVKVVDPVHGTFDSKAEYARWVELRILEKAGAIFSLKRQVPFSLHASSESLLPRTEVGKYIADFVYRLKPFGPDVVEDVKGVITAMFRWKARHFEIQYGFPITIVGRVKKSRKKKMGSGLTATRRGAGKKKGVEA